MLYILLIIIAVLCLAIIWLVFDFRKKMKDPVIERDRDIKLALLAESMNNISRQNQELRQTMDSKLSETHRTTQDSIKNTLGVTQDIHNQSVKQITEITEKLVKLEEQNKQVMTFTEQLKNLQDILKNPKQRGVLGEYFLEETLKNVLPPNSYQMQYKFKDGKIVDAVVYVKEKIIPIDSKFSLENYEKILSTNDAKEREELEKAFKQDLKKRIDETSQYIRPLEKTLDFAFMFIPSEAIYYDLLVNKIGAVQINTRSMVEYAFCEKHVVIVSPTSFLAYLQTVLQGLRAMQIEESAKEILGNVEKLEKHILAFNEYMKKLGNNMSTTVNSYNTAYKELSKIDKDVAKITEGEATVEPTVIEKPHIADSD